MFNHHHSDRSTSSATSSGPAVGKNAKAERKNSKGDKQSERSNGNFVSRLGFKFDVANFDINAVSPTSW